MATQWLNVFMDQGGTAPNPPQVKLADVVHMNGKKIRILESDRSGAVILTQNGLSWYGDAEVYLKINFRNGTSGTLGSAPHSCGNPRRGSS